MCSQKEGNTEGGDNRKAVVRQRRDMAIQMEKGRQYCVEGSTDWDARIAHLIRRFNVPRSRADELMRKYLGHAGLAASELEGVGGAVVDADPNDDPDGMIELFNVHDEDGSGLLDAGEVANLCNRLGIAMGQDDIAAAMDEMDHDGNGEVECAEFGMWYQEAIVGGGSKSSFARALKARQNAISNSNRGVKQKRSSVAGAKRMGRQATIAERAAQEAVSTNAMRARGASSAASPGF